MIWTGRAVQIVPESPCKASGPFWRACAGALAKAQLEGGAARVGVRGGKERGPAWSCMVAEDGTQPSRQPS